VYNDASNLDYLDAAVIWMSNLCFEPKTRELLFNIALSNSPLVFSYVSPRLYDSCKKIIAQQDISTDTKTLKTSWSNNSTFYVLSKSSNISKIHHIYRDIPAFGYTEKTENTSTFNSLYDERKPLGIKKTLNSINWRNDDIFVDLGSGLGKITIQVGIDTYCKASYGLDLDLYRYYQSLRALVRLKKIVSTKKNPFYK
jgi:hypothetical protein